jgi:hypothetical protein
VGADRRADPVGADHQAGSERLAVAELDGPARPHRGHLDAKAGADRRPVGDRGEQHPVQVAAAHRQGVVEPVAEVRHGQLGDRPAVGAAHGAGPDAVAAALDRLRHPRPARTARPLGCSRMPAPTACGSCTRSSRVTSAPASASSSAAVMPPMPAPTTTTSLPSSVIAAPFPPHDTNPAGGRGQPQPGRRSPGLVGS